MEKNLLDFQFHYILKTAGVHSMDAIVYNDCEKQLIASIYYLADLFELDKDAISIEVLARGEGGVKEWLRINVAEKVMLPVVIAILTIWAQHYFNSDMDTSNQTKINIEAAIALKEAGFTFEEAEALVKDNPRLMDFCSKYYKSAQKDTSLQEIETSLGDEGKVIHFQSSIKAADFSTHIVEIRKNTNVIHGTTIAVASPVLADVKRLKWRGVYNLSSIPFTLEDKDFIDKVHNRQVKFEYGTTIKCDLRIEETQAGSKAPTFRYVVEKVHSWSDGVHYVDGDKSYLSADNKVDEQPKDSI